MSFMYIMNSKGPSIASWGTPVDIAYYQILTCVIVYYILFYFRQIVFE